MILRYSLTSSDRLNADDNGVAWRHGPAHYLYARWKTICRFPWRPGNCTVSTAERAAAGAGGRARQCAGRPNGSTEAVDLCSGWKRYAAVVGKLSHKEAQKSQI